MRLKILKHLKIGFFFYFLRKIVFAEFFFAGIYFCDLAKNPQKTQKYILGKVYFVHGIREARECG